MRYFNFKNHRLARSHEFGKFEWFEYGEWVENESRSRYLMDCMMDYGDADPFDYDEISEEGANRLINKWFELYGNRKNDKKQ